MLLDRITRAIGSVDVFLLELAPEAQAKLVGELAPITNNPDTAQRAYRAAVALIEAEYWGKRARPPDSYLESVAQAARKSLET